MRHGRLDHGQVWAQYSMRQLPAEVGSRHPGGALDPVHPGCASRRSTPKHLAAALGTHIVTLPEQVRRSLTLRPGQEMARHLQFTIDTGVAVYFCDPKSPWQRGTNENTNGLIRQYLPKRTDLRPHSQDDLDAIALELNGRPRKTLGFMTPSEKYAEAVAPTH
jgi:IS30 family transposase